MCAYKTKDYAKFIFVITFYWPDWGLSTHTKHQCESTVIRCRSTAMIVKQHHHPHFTKTKYIWKNTTSLKIVTKPSVPPTFWRKTPSNLFTTYKEESSESSAATNKGSPFMEDALKGLQYAHNHIHSDNFHISHDILVGLKICILLICTGLQLHRWSLWMNK